MSFYVPLAAVTLPWSATCYYSYYGRINLVTASCLFSQFSVLFISSLILRRLCLAWLANFLTFEGSFAVCGQRNRWIASFWATRIMFAFVCSCCYNFWWHFSVYDLQFSHDWSYQLWNRTFWIKESILEAPFEWIYCNLSSKKPKGL